MRVVRDAKLGDADRLERADTAVQRASAAAARRARQAQAREDRADAASGIVIVRVATAYEKALDPGSRDDPCRYMTAAARAEVVANLASGAQAGSCTAIVRLRERGANVGPRSMDLGAATVELGAPVRVPTAPGGLGPSQVEGAEVRFANVDSRSPVALIMDRGRWRIAMYR